MNRAPHVARAWVRLTSYTAMLAGAALLTQLALAAPAQQEAAPLPEACRTDCITPYGEMLGTASGGTAAYSNCSAKCFVPAPNTENGTYTGIRWQCVEYARRWLLRNRGVVYGDVDVAADIWNKIDHVTRVTDRQTLPLTAYANGAASAPQPGDLLIYAREFLGTGHVAVITEINAAVGTVAVAEQNFLNERWRDGRARILPLISRDGSYWVLDAYVLGWKRVASPAN